MMLGWGEGIVLRALNNMLANDSDEKGPAYEGIGVKVGLTDYSLAGM